MFFFLLAFPAIGQVTEEVYQTIASGHATLVFKMAFFRNPDLSALIKAERDLSKRLHGLVERFLEDLSGDLVSRGFGDVSVSWIDDYRRLRDERWKGEFQILFCDQAAYAMHQRRFPYDPYEVLLEEGAGPGTATSEAGIWVREDSKIKRIEDLDQEQKHIALVDRYCLLGGALQMTQLAGLPFNRVVEGTDYQTTECGSVSDAVLRLVTGLATRRPIEAAFLPRSASGFLVAADYLGVSEAENLPIRMLPNESLIELPGRPLLADRFLLDQFPELRDRFTDFFLAQNEPWEWRSTSPDRFEGLREYLSPLFDGPQPGP